MRNIDKYSFVYIIDLQGEKMLKNSKWVLALLLILFNTLFLTCTNQADKSINGSWISDIFEIRLNNGEFEESINNMSWRKGSYTTGNGEITVLPTHIFGGGTNLIFGVSEEESGIESKWYTIDEFITVFKLALIKMGLSESMAEMETTDFINSFNAANKTVTYSLSGDTLYLTTDGVTQNFKRK